MRQGGECGEYYIYIFIIENIIIILINYYFGVSVSVGVGSELLSVIDVSNFGKNSIAKINKNTNIKWNKTVLCQKTVKINFFSKIIDKRERIALLIP